VERREINGTAVNINSYRIGDQYYCHIENVDPGATIARSAADSAERALEHALQKAESRLKG
jgi:hypothetical protein